MKLNTKFLLLLFFLILGSPAYAEDWAPDSLEGKLIKLGAGTEDAVYIFQKNGVTYGGSSPQYMTYSINLEVEKTGSNTFHFSFWMAQSKLLFFTGSVRMSGPTQGIAQLSGVINYPAHPYYGQELGTQESVLEMMDYEPILPSVPVSGTYELNYDAYSHGWVQPIGQSSNFDFLSHLPLNEDWTFQWNDSSQDQGSRLLLQFMDTNFEIDLELYPNYAGIVFPWTPLIGSSLSDGTTNTYASTHRFQSSSYDPNKESGFRLQFDASKQEFTILFDENLSGQWQTITTLDLSTGLESLTFNNQDGATQSGIDLLFLDDRPIGSEDLTPYFNTELQASPSIRLYYDHDYMKESVFFKLAMGQDSIDQVSQPAGSSTPTLEPSDPTADWAPDSLAGMTILPDGESNTWLHIEEDASGAHISTGELLDFKYTKTGPSTFEILHEISAVQQIKMSAAMTGPKAGNYTFHAIHKLPGHPDLGQELYYQAGFFEFVDLNPVVPSILPSGDYSFTPSSSSTPHWKRNVDYYSAYDLNHSFRLDQDWHFEASSDFTMDITLLGMDFRFDGIWMDPTLDDFIFDDFMYKNFSLNNPSSYRLVYRKDGKKLSVSTQNISDEEWREVFEISFEEGYQSIVFHGSDGQTLRGKDAYPVEYSMPDGSILDLGEFLNADLRSLDQFFLNAEDYSNGETFAFKLVVGQDSLDQLGAETSEGAEVTNIFSAAGSDLGSGWRSIEWFGFYFPHSSGWFYHMDHGWIYSHAESLDSIWYWHQTYKWCWTNQTVYPWVWFHDEQSWKYYFKQTGNWMAPVTSTESDSQTQDSNNSIDNSSGSNSTSSFDPDNPPKTWTVSSASNLEMIWVEPGTFMMGSPTTESGRSTSETQHQVTLTQGFYLGKYEVTQAQYEAVMTGNTDGLSATPSNYSNNPNRPVENVSWSDIQVFLTRLNQSDSTNIPTGWTYVLPTEAQWEYACRAGTTTTYHWGNSISSSNANYNRNIGSTLDVGQYSPNAWGFFDMHGNVWEWIADWYSSSYYGSNAVTDPTGPASGSYRVVRGGSWGNPGTNLRSANRSSPNPSYRDINIGFRVGFQKVQ